MQRRPMQRGANKSPGRKKGYATGEALSKGMNYLSPRRQAWGAICSGLRHSLQALNWAVGDIQRPRAALCCGKQVGSLAVGSTATFC